MDSRTGAGSDALDTCSQPGSARSMITRQPSPSAYSNDIPVTGSRGPLSPIRGMRSWTVADTGRLCINPNVGYLTSFSGPNTYFTALENEAVTA